MAHTSVNGISLIGPRDLVNGSAPLREGAESPTPPSLGTVRFVAGTAQAIQTAHWHELLKEHPCAPKSIACWPAAPQRAQLRLRIGATPSVTAIVPISSRPPGAQLVAEGCGQTPIYGGGQLPEWATVNAPSSQAWGLLL